MDSFAQNQWLSETLIDESIPTCLDNIIRKNREQGSLHLSTAAELQALHCSIGAEFPPNKILYDWTLITLTTAKSATQTAEVIFALGYTKHPKRVIMTSAVLGMDQAQGLIHTRNSVYALDPASTRLGEPSQDGLMMVCTKLVASGVGQYFGIPALFI